MSYVDKISIAGLTRTAKQTIALYISQIGAILFGVLFTVINTRYLSQSEFGTLNFYIQVITFLALIFEFGYFTAGSRLIAIQKDYQEERKIIGALIVIGLMIVSGFALTLFFASFFIDGLFDSNIQFFLLIGLVPSAAFPFQYLMQLVFQGSNEVIKLSFYNVLPRLFYFAMIGVAVLTNTFNLTFTAFAYVLSMFVITVLILFMSRPAFKEFKKYFALIKKETKEYGFQVYTGRVAGMMGYQSNILLIQYFVKEIHVANYALVNFFTSPISMFSRSLCTSLFKGFANQNVIPQRVFRVNYIWLLGASIIYLLIGGIALEFLFSNKYTNAVPIILPMVAANFFMGAFQPYNFFLSAKGKGKYLRNTAIVLTVSTLFFNLMLIPSYGALGAAYATLISLFLDYLVHVYYYRKSLKE
ncbi:MAG: oligosaccharide flippase family protein [Bacteroidetes bacterium]|nr:oligosaccharide flippase family protein [Bacteroidota bacterium]